jgi:hypothetical protein
MVTAPAFVSRNEVLVAAFAMTFWVFITNGLVQFVPIDPLDADRTIVPAVTTSPAPVINDVALFAAKLYVPLAMLSTPQVVSAAKVTVPVAVSFAKTFCPAALASNATLLEFIVIGVPAAPIDPAVDIIDISFAVTPVPAVAMFPAVLK